MVELQLEVGLTCAWWELPARCSCNSLFFKCLGGWVWNVAGAGLSLVKRGKILQESSMVSSKSD